MLVLVELEIHRIQYVICQCLSSQSDVEHLPSSKVKHLVKNQSRYLADQTHLTKDKDWSTVTGYNY